MPIADCGMPLAPTNEALAETAEPDWSQLRVA